MVAKEIMDNDQYLHHDLNVLGEYVMFSRYEAGEIIVQR